MKDYTNHCDECDLPMTHRSKDGSLVYCTHCWVPKPVPLEYLGSNARLQIREGLKKLQLERTV